ncbi:phytolongin Phyl1.1-like [Nymphaea colorata]|uniref:Longin domain-containing protein n=1 Tax=Nymphaea colorata TaxID=210225 RepID=A0A5K1ETC0_9MAGN|nr:phytolongin Phyl1.1-like [Nymphaea colorata]VVW54378.1 unnamed protein product [Nymphaea colorata]
MVSVPNTVYYCCVSKGTKVLAAYTAGDAESEKWAALCLERIPPFHAHYLQTMRSRIFGFLMEDDHVYFTITDEGLGKSGVLQFLVNVRDHFNKVVNNGEAGGLGLTSFSLREELVPVLHRLIMSLENVSRIDSNRQNLCSVTAESDPLVCHDKDGLESSTVTPFLEKAKYVAEVKADVEEEGNGSIKGPTVNVVIDSNVNGVHPSGFPLQRSASRKLAAQQLARRKWWRHVWIVLIVDMVLCFILFGVWLGVCRGLRCVSTS